jgi:hypothetical protein
MLDRRCFRPAPNQALIPLERPYRPCGFQVSDLSEVDRKGATEPWSSVPREERMLALVVENL